jgi:prepilin-type processing-associated H-X9-DG protein
VTAAVPASKFANKTCHAGVAPSNSTVLAAASGVGTNVTYACSSYVAVVSSKNVNGPYDAVIYPKSRTRTVDILDGQSNTLIVGERPPSKDLVWGWWGSPYRGDITMGTENTYRLPIKAAALPGSAPTLCPAVPYFGPGSLENPCDTQHFWSFHPQGSNWLFADGSVHFIQYSAASQVPKMATRAASEVVDWLDVF